MPAGTNAVIIIGRINFVNEKTMKLKKPFIHARMFDGKERIYYNLHLIRPQVFMIEKGYAIQSQGLLDLVRGSVTFTNMQKEMETRVLIGFHLRRAAIDLKRIKG
ncbi:MAG: substrate-binding domain-containing protein [Desulfomonilaceae bacterium]